MTIAYGSPKFLHAQQNLIPWHLMQGLNVDQCAIQQETGRQDFRYAASISCMEGFWNFCGTCVHHGSVVARSACCIPCFLILQQTGTRLFLHLSKELSRINFPVQYFSRSVSLKHFLFILPVFVCFFSLFGFSGQGCCGILF